MLLRRFMGHFARQDWFAVALDTIVVMAGIFMGMAANDWREAQSDERLKISYYHQLLQDLEIDRATAIEGMGHNAGHQQALKLLNAALGDPGFVITEPGPLLVSMARSGYTFTPVATTQTYDELVSTGNLRLIDDTDLKRAIGTYYASRARDRQWDTLIRQMQADFRRASSGLITPDQMQDLRLDNTIDATVEEAAIALERARGRPELKDILSTMTSIHLVALNESKRMLADIEKLEALIRAKLEKVGREVKE